MWSSGDIVALRNVWFGRIRGASAGFVVEQTQARIVVWVPVGSEFVGPSARGVPTEWKLVPGTWDDGGVVVHHFGEPWIATHVRPVDKPAWWYVDIVDSVRVTSTGIDYRDLFLDVVTEDELRVVDEDDLADAVALGVASTVEAHAAQRAAAHVLALVEGGAPPFHGEWERWEPPPAWAVPTLPPGWDVL